VAVEPGGIAATKAINHRARHTARTARS